MMSENKDTLEVGDLVWYKEEVCQCSPGSVSSYCNGSCSLLEVDRLGMIYYILTLDYPPSTATRNYYKVLGVDGSDYYFDYNELTLVDLEEEGDGNEKETSEQRQ